jgi:hypothetical protein
VEQLLNSLSEAAAVGGSELSNSNTPLDAAAAAPPPPPPPPSPVAEMPDSTTPNGTSSKRNATACSGSRKAPKLLQERPGFWLPGDFYVQTGDTLFVEVARDEQTVKDPCTFIVPGSSSSSSSEEGALVWVFRLESFTDTHMYGRFYWNQQRGLRAPLRFRGKAQRLDRAGLKGVMHSLHPGAVMQQLEEELAGQVEAALFQAEDEEDV